MWILLYLQLANPTETTIDWPTLSARWAILHDAPPIEDAGRLPPPFYATAASDFACLHRNYVEKLASWQEEFRPWAIEAEHYADFWSAVDTAHSGYSMTLRREHLKKVRRMIGPEAYNHCRWPEIAPLWRFIDE